MAMRRYLNNCVPPTENSRKFGGWGAAWLVLRRRRLRRALDHAAFRPFRRTVQISCFLGDFVCLMGKSPHISYITELFGPRVLFFEMGLLF